MIFFIMLALLILIEGLLISASLIKFKDNYLKDFYGKYNVEAPKDIYPELFTDVP